jgi:hypothetical protein
VDAALSQAGHRRPSLRRRAAEAWRRFT